MSGNRTPIYIKFDTEKETIAEALIWASLVASGLSVFSSCREHLLEVVI